MEEYKGNSYKSREKQDEIVEKRATKVVSGTVKTKKKNKLLDAFISEDATNVKTYIFTDVLVPTIKKAIYDMVTTGIDMILNGESGMHRKNSSNASKVSYRSYYDEVNRRQNNSYNRSSRTGYSYDDIIFDNRGEAEDVLARMDELVATYGLVRVADLYDLVGITGNFTDNRYGWTDIRSAKIVIVSDGYMIKLPRALPLD